MISNGGLFSLGVMAEAAASTIAAFTVQAAALLNRLGARATKTERTLQKTPGTGISS
jgi:hypothetical protein